MGQVTWVLADIMDSVDKSTNVLKTGPDRPVRPVEPPTGQLFGSVRLKEPFYGRTGIEPFKPPVGPPNRTNRPVFHEPAKPSF